MGFSLKTTAKPATEQSAAKPATASKPVGFLKTGLEAKAALAKADAERKNKMDMAGKAYRFYMKVGEDANLTFLDGRIDPNTGILDIPYANEHRIKLDRWVDFLCTEDNEPCPLCAAGEKKTFVGYMTVIDHREREYEKDGKTIKVPATRRLFVAKTETLKQLTKMAEKRETGLVGITYEVSRTGDKKPAVGDLFDRIADHSPEEIAEAFPDFGTPLDYNEELPYHTAAELNELGIGKKVTTIGSSSFAKGTKADDVDDEVKVW